MATSKKKGMKLGAGLILVLLVAVLCGGTSFFLISNANKTAAATEAAMPESAISTYLNQIKQKNYSGAYENSMILAPHLNSEEDYIAGLQKIYEGVDLDSLVYQQEAEDQGIYTYSLISGTTQVATLKLENKDGTWLAATVFSGNNNYTIEAPVGTTVYVNGHPLDDTYLVKGDKLALNFTGMADTQEAPLVNQYQVDNLLGEPAITTDGQSGLVKDALSNTYFVGTLDTNPEDAQLFEEATMALASWPSNDGSFAAASSYVNTNTDFYDRIRTMDTQWYAAHSGASFDSVQVQDIIKQSDNSMMANVLFDFSVTLSGETTTYHGCYQITFLNNKIVGFAINNFINPNNPHYEEAQNQ